MSSTPGLGLDVLAKIIKLEVAKGYNNLAVSGGLDRLLINLKDKTGTDFPFQMPENGYISLSKANRISWINECLSILEKMGYESAPYQVDEPITQMNHPDSLESVGIDSGIGNIPGIATKLASKFKKLGIITIKDMLYTMPLRYNDFGNIKNVSSLNPDSDQTIICNLWEAREITLGRNLRSTEAIVGDATGNIRVVWFNQPYLAKQLKPGIKLVLSGRVNTFKGRKVLESPEYEILNGAEQLTHTGRIVPVYNLTSGLTQRNTRRIIRKALEQHAGNIEDFLPSSVIKRTGLMNLRNAIWQSHYPDDENQLSLARRRLAFDELFLMQLYVFSKRKTWRESDGGVRISPKIATLKDLFSRLDFSLTNAQDTALKEILADINDIRPMSRLLQGDVGSGKTIVAIACLMCTATNGYQSAMMAPTEILAEQHYKNLFDLLADKEADGKTSTFSFSFGASNKSITVGLLTGSQSKKEKQKIQYMLANQEIDIIVGTHAILQANVDMPRLALAVVDEQHRFGVMQRSQLRDKGISPHLLVMSATPIPRSLSLTIYGDLDISILDELPSGRQKIQTKLIHPNNREASYKFINDQISQGRQAFVVCPIIEESDSLQVRAATSEYTRLSQDIFPNLSIGLIHGKMKVRDKEKVIEDFRRGNLDILVSTPVIEVGIDIPNASVMLIEGADRFGLAQLHQFRGRVGRGKYKSYCLLSTDSHMSQSIERLKIMEQMDDGFSVAEEDLRFRGPGDYFGTRQSGLPSLKIARLSDTDLLYLARKEASSLLQADPNLNLPDSKSLIPILESYSSFASTQAS